MKGLRAGPAPLTLASLGRSASTAAAAGSWASDHRSPLFTPCCTTGMTLLRTCAAAVLALVLTSTAANGQDRSPLAPAPVPPVVVVIPGTVTATMDKVAAAMVEEGLVVEIRDPDAGSIRTSLVPGPLLQRGGASPTTFLPEYSAMAIVRSVGVDSARVALTIWRRLTDLNQQPRRPTQLIWMNDCPGRDSGRGTPALIAQCWDIRNRLVQQLQRIAATLESGGTATP